MLRKKIILGMLVLGSCIAGITQAQAPGITNPTFTILNGSTNTYNGITTSFDPNANFTSDTYLSKVFFYNYNTSNPFKSATFWHDGKLYIVSRGLSSNTLKWQGYAYLCKVESIATNQFCRTYNNEGNPSLTEYYTEQYANPDYFQFYGYNQPHIGCFVYEDLGEKLCFGVQQENSNGLDTTTQLFNTVPSGYDDPRFAELAGDSLWTSTEEQPQMPEVTTGQICPLLKFEIDMYGRNYNTGLCYRPKYIGETESTSIFELFNSYQEFETYENLYYSSCVQPYTQEYCFSKFTGHEEQLAYITYINNKQDIDKMKVYQYCHLQLNFTEEQKRGSGTCQIPDEELYATGINQQEATPNPLEQLTNALEDAREIIVPSTGTVRDELLPEGVVSWKGLATNVDLVKSMVSLGSKIMNIFITRQVQYQDGIIPYYISSLLILIFLYRLYKK